MANCHLKIADFGLAKRLRPGVGLTPSDAVLGTPSYMAPEQAGRNHEVGPAADVYSLGAILYELLTGRPPFRAASTLETLQQVLHDEPVPPRRLQPRLSADLEVICLKALAKEPARRYASAAELADDLTRFLDSRPIRARAPGVLYRFGKFAGRHRAAVAGVVAVFLALVGGVVGTSVGMVRAQQQRDRALEAERETRRLLAASFAQAGQLAMRRGAWREALENFGRALEEGHPDSASLRLLRVRAYAALHDGPRALRELDELAAAGDLGRLEGPVLLWRADILLTRGTDMDSALADVRRALARGLPPAEAEYARGLLAETTPQALEHFRSAVHLDPFHARANGMLGMLLITLGRLPEARERVAVAARLFPEDPTPRIAQALLAALDGDAQAAEAALEQVRGQLGGPQLDAARAWVELVRQVRPFGAKLAEPETEPLALLTRVMLPATRAWLTVRAPDDAPGTTPPLLAPLPPVLLKAVRPLPPALLANVFGGDANRLIDVLSAAVRVHPDGMLFLALGLQLGNQNRWVEAERAFVQASRNTSIILVERPALAYAALSQWVLATRGEPAQRAAMNARAVENVRKLLALGGVTAGLADPLSDLALQAGELNLARELTSVWQQQARADLRPPRRRLAIEVKAGAFGPAIAIADRILKQKPDDVETVRQRGEAVAALLRQAEALRPARQGRPGSGTRARDGSTARETSGPRVRGGPVTCCPCR